EDAGAVHHHVQSAQEFAGGGQVGGHAGLIGDVGGEVAGVPGAQLGDRSRALFVIEIEQRDLAAIGDEELGNTEAEAGNAAGDDGTNGGQLHWNNPAEKRAR